MAPRRMARRRDDRGSSAAIEGIILFPLVLLLVMTIIQAAVYFHAQNTAQNAANGGVVAGAGTDGTRAAAEAAVQDRLDRAGGSSLLTGTTVIATRTADEVTVTVQGTSLTFVPGLPPLTVTSTVTAPVERFTAP